MVSFLPRFANTTETEGEDADRLPLWHARDESNHLVDGAPTCQESSSAQPSGHVSEDTPYSTMSDNKQLFPLRSNTPDLEGSLPLPTIDDRPLSPARNPPPVTIYNYIPVLGLIRWLIRKILRRAKQVKKATFLLKYLSSSQSEQNNQHRFI